MGKREGEISREQREQEVFINPFMVSLVTAGRLEQRSRLLTGSAAGPRRMIRHGFCLMFISKMQC